MKTSVALLWVVSAAIWDGIAASGFKENIFVDRQAIPDDGVTYLTQADFDDGTYLIDSPGVYKLSENIVFNPNSVAALRIKYPDRDITSYDAGDVLPQQFRYYDPAAFGIGFFAAIAVRSHNAIIDLNGHIIEQGIEHALQMRFFALIQLNSAPFLGGSGPHKFVGHGGLRTPHNVTVMNGRLGRSAHHGILGNDNVNVTIRDVKFHDFEIAAIHLNGAKDVLIENCRVRGNRKDVPIYGTFSTGRFIRRYVNHLVNDESPVTLKVGGQDLTAIDIQAQLKSALNTVWTDLVELGLPTIDKVAHPDEYALFHNAAGIPDGNAYGIVINQHDLAVNGFSTEIPGEGNEANNIQLRNTNVLDISVAVNEIIGLCNNPVLCDQAQKDTVAATWQIWQGHPDNKDSPIAVSSFDPATAIYIGNAIANAQAFVAKAVFAGEFVRFPTMSVARNSIGPASIAFVESGTTVADLIQSIGGFLCNGDSMFHVNKGVIGIRVDGARGVVLDNVRVVRVSNQGAIGSSACTFMHSKDHIPGGEYGGAYARGISIASASNVTAISSTIRDIVSTAGSAIGVDVQMESRGVTLDDVKIKFIRAATLVAPGDISTLYNLNPTPLPLAAGLRVGHSATDPVSVAVIIKDVTSPAISEEISNGVSVPYPVTGEATKPGILQGVAVTGWNKRKGLPAFALPILGELFLDVGGAFNENGISEAIGASTSCDAEMACYADKDIYQLFFNQPVADRYPNENVKFADYEQVVRHNSETTTLKIRDRVLWWEKSNGADEESLTVRRWLEASGTIEFDCDVEGGPLLHLEVTGAIPGGLYTLWGFFYDQHLPFPRGLQSDFPFGGTSNNVYVANADGSVSATRKVALCLPELTREERRQLINLFFVYHPDGRVNAGVGHFVNTPPFLGPGCTATPQIMWSAGGTQKLEPTGCPE